MKKLFLVLAAAFAMVACQTGLDEVDVTNGLADVTFEVGTPAARAYSDGETATHLQYAVYEETGELTSLVKTDATINLSTTVKLQLVTGNTYTVIFWAAAPNAPYDVNFAQTLGEAAMTVNYNNAVCNAENRDAFYAKHTFKVTGAQTETIELKRPFAQLNIGTSDYEASTNAGYNPAYSSVKVTSIYNTLNFSTGAVSGETEVIFGYSAIAKTEKFPVDGYEYLAMNYLLVPADKHVVDIEFGYGESSTAAEKTRIVGSVPVQRNYRTNIYGQLLTSNVDINIEIKPAYNEPAHELDELHKAALNGGEITLNEDVVLTTPLEVVGEMTINLNGKTITGPSVATDADGNKIHSIINNGKLTIINGTITSQTVNGGSAIYTYGDLTLDNVTINGAPSNTATGTASYAVNVVGANAKVTVNNSTINGRGAVGVTNGAKAELNGGVYHTPAVAWGHAVYAYGEGTQVVINGGTFSEGYEYAADLWGMYQIYSGNKAQVIVNGGTFEKWDCANGYDLCTATEGNITIYGGTFADNPASQNGKNFIAEGYKAIEKNGLYYVVAEGVDAVASTQSELASAVTAGGEVVLTAGAYTMPAGDSFNANTVLTCEEGVVFEGNSKLNVNGATIVGATFSNPTGTAVDQTINGTFKGCTFEGKNGARWCYAGDTVVFEDCVFSGSTYGVHFDGGANDVLFKNCVLSGFNALGGEITLTTFEGCTFVGNGKSGYNGANLWGSTKLINCEFTFDGSTATEWIHGRGDNKTYEFENCTVNGVALTSENYDSFDQIGVYGNASITKVDGTIVVATADELNAAVASNVTVTITADIEGGSLKLPANLSNFTLHAANGATLKNFTISAADGNAYHYENLTFDGLTFDNSRIVLTGWRNGDETLKNLTITNCVFQNLDDTTSEAPVHINKDAAEAVENFTFTNNVINGATGGSKSGVYAQVTGNVVFENNVINNVSFRPYVIQVTTNDGIADSFSVKGNTFSGSSKGRAQGLGNNAEGTDAVQLIVSGNIFKDITEAQQICYWNFNAATTTADLSKNYYSIDIEANPSGIYYNRAASSVEDLKDMGVYPFYTELNADGTINLNSLKQAE